MRKFLSTLSLLRDADLTMLPPWVVLNGLWFIWRARRNHHDWDWLIVPWIATILAIALLGLLWRKGVVALEIGMTMQALVYSVYLEIARYHFRGYWSLPIAYFNVSLITSGLIWAYNEWEKECAEQMQSKSPG
ncbi:MAG: hypothetical protein IMX00_05015 [Limnochordales bacterium]|nr:hypothetical protein [Limnochordales bacterium]